MFVLKQKKIFFFNIINYIPQKKYIPKNKILLFFFQFCARSGKTKKMNVVLSGSKEDLKTNQSIADLCLLKPILTHDFSIEDTTALYEMADLVATIDSMSTHLASAMDTPVISIFGPTNDLNWRPWKVKYQVINLSKADDPTFACRPCGMDGCEGTKISQCLVQMNPQMILKSIEKTLKINT